MPSKRFSAIVVLALLAGYAQSANAVSAPPVQARTGMVVTAQRLASNVGVDILRQGGNAIDAAVAVGYALAVVLPCCGNLGGGGFATIRLANGKDTFLNFREKAISSPPPSSGGVTLCLILNILEGYPMKELGLRSAAGIQLTIEAMRHAYVDRNFALGDPDFVSNPLDRLLSRDYAAEIRSKIIPGKAGNSQDVAPGVPPHEGTETTHYSIVDKDGNAVAVTYTINAGFGAKVIAGDTGFFLNDEMDDFTTKPGAANLFGLVQGKKNAIQPGKRPLSSMSPTIVAKGGRPFMIIGSPGGARIITITLEAVMNVIDYGLDLQEALDAPRFHHQWLPDEVDVEPLALSPDTKQMLTEMGYKVVEQPTWGAAEGIVVMPKAASPAVEPAKGAPDPGASARMKPGFLYGANDNRRPAGAAVGY